MSRWWVVIGLSLVSSGVIIGLSRSSSPAEAESADPEVLPPSGPQPSLNMGPVPDADLASARFAEVVLRHCTDRVPPPAAELDDNQRVELSLIPTGSLPPGLTQAAIDQAIARHEQARLDEAAKDDEQSYEGTTDGRDAD